MTYENTKKRIGELYREKENAYTVKMEWREILKTVGFGEVEGTGEYAYLPTRVYDYEKIKKLEKEINNLYETIREEEKRRNEEKKYKRYLREIKALKKEIEEKENWINNYLNK